jgi:rod shape-determining protein MreD
MLIFAFVLALIALVLQGIIVPHISILAFAPFLAFALIRSPLTQALFLSVLAGAIMDLLSEDPMGVHALNYVLVTAIFFRFRKHFSSDQALHLSVLTGVISSFSTLLQWFLLFLFDRRVPFAGEWVFSDLIGMPVIDALYAFVWFAAPLTVAKKFHRMWVLFWLKKKNPSLTSH